MARQSLLTTWLSSENEREPDSSPKRSRVENEPLSDSRSSVESTSTAPRRFEPHRLSTEARLDMCCQPYNIGMLAEFVRQLNGEDKFQALNNLYKPPPSYVFPQHKEGAGRLNMPGLDTRERKTVAIVFLVYFFVKVMKVWKS